MKLLLDSHIVLWSLGEPARLTASQREALLDTTNEVFVSAVTAWELAIKQSLGKLVLPGPAETWLLSAVTSAGFAWCPVTAEDAVRVRALPWHHRDPFDRLLVAQAGSEHVLVSQDDLLEPYQVTLLR